MSQLFFLVFALLALFAIGAFYYLNVASLETEPSKDLCSDFADCGEEEYCAPLNHFERSYVEDGKDIVVEEMVSDGGVVVKKTIIPNMVMVNERRFLFGYYPRKSLGNRHKDVMVIELNGSNFGLCRPKGGKKFSDICQMKVNPPMLKDGKYVPYFNMRFSCL